MFLRFLRLFNHIDLALIKYIISAIPVPLARPFDRVSNSEVGLEWPNSALLLIILPEHIIVSHYCISYALSEHRESWITSHCLCIYVLTYHQSERIRKRPVPVEQGIWGDLLKCGELLKRRGNGICGPLDWLCDSISFCTVPNVLVLRAMGMFPRLFPSS